MTIVFLILVVSGAFAIMVMIETAHGFGQKAGRETKDHSNAAILKELKRHPERET
jgi:hypothetical protein